MERESLIEYLPRYLQEYLEINMLMSTEQIEIDRMWTTIQDTLNAAFIMDTDENSVQRYEKMLGVIPLPDESLEDRQFDLLVRFNEQPPFTLNFLKVM